MALGVGILVIGRKQASLASWQSTIQNMQRVACAFCQSSRMLDSGTKNTHYLEVALLTALPVEEVATPP